jgi:hypothetical protein
MSLTTTSKVVSAVAFPAVRSEPAPEIHQLTEQAHRFISSLDESVRPNMLAARFPRILNKVAELWRRPSLMDRYFDDLLMDSRGNRQGFPISILLELSTLKEYYHTTFPMRSGVWDENNLTERFR